MFGLIRHRALLQRNIFINVGKLTANPSELVPKKPKLTKLTKGSSNQITSFNERGAQITITKYSEMELQDMIEEGKIEAEEDHKTPFIHRIVAVLISCLGYYFIVPPEGKVKIIQLTVTVIRIPFVGIILTQESMYDKMSKVNTRGAS